MINSRDRDDRYKDLSDDQIKRLLDQYREDYRCSGPRNHIVEALDAAIAELKRRGING